MSFIKVILHFKNYPTSYLSVLQVRIHRIKNVWSPHGKLNPGPLNNAKCTATELQQPMYTIKLFRYNMLSYHRLK